MEALERILGKVRQNTTTLVDMAAKDIEYKCQECRDTGWIEVGVNKYIRCDCVDIERYKLLWEHSGINSEQQALRLNDFKPFDDITKAARDKAIAYIESYDEVKSNRENSYGLFGQPGAGKTHIVVSIGANLLNRKPNPIPVVYMPYLESIRELKANSMDDEYYNKLLNRYCRARLLIIDDLFKDKVKNGQLLKDRYGQVIGMTEADLKHIYPILNYRYQKYLPTLISTECTPQMLIELDEALAGRILETCSDNITVFNDIKYNYRLRKFVKR